MAGEIDQLKIALQHCHGEAGPLRLGFERLIGAYKSERDEFDVLKVAHDKTLSELGVITQVLNQLRNAVSVLMSQEKEEGESIETKQAISRLEGALQVKAKEARESQKQIQILTERANKGEKLALSHEKELHCLRDAASSLKDELDEANFMAEAERSAHSHTRAVGDAVKLRLVSSSQMGQQAVERSRQAEDQLTSIQQANEALEAKSREQEAGLVACQARLDQALDAREQSGPKEGETERIHSMEAQLSSLYLELSAAREARNQEDEAMREVAVIQAKLTRSEALLAESNAEREEARQKEEV